MNTTSMNHTVLPMIVFEFAAVVAILSPNWARAQPVIREWADPGYRRLGVYGSGPDSYFDYQLVKLHLGDSFPGKKAYWAGLKSKAETDADIRAWSPHQVRDFHDRLERTPDNHRDLADLAHLRLLDLKDDLENGDSSVARILQGVTREVDMRRFIGRDLRDKSFGRYSIPQEEEFADAKKPDLRFHGMNFDGPIPCELKLADKWTGPHLFERLENQLCGDYLRDNRSTHGFFVLVNQGRKRSWRVPDTSKLVDFNGLVDNLERQWEKIALNYPGVDQITVVGIDLTVRSG